MESGKQGKSEDLNLIHSRIECLSCKEEEAFPAIVFDVTGDSVCLVTDHKLDPEESVSIHTSQDAPEKGTEASTINGSTGVVKWSRPVVRKDRRLYLAGLSLPHAGGKGRNGNACEVCGTATSEEDACSTEGFTWLCLECNEKISRLPEKLEEITDKYLAGNPL